MKASLAVRAFNRHVQEVSLQIPERNRVPFITFHDFKILPGEYSESDWGPAMIS